MAKVLAGVVLLALVSERWIRARVAVAWRGHRRWEKPGSLRSRLLPGLVLLCSVLLEMLAHPFDTLL